MKKFLIVLAVFILILTGLFLYRGGHHAIFLAQAMEEWLDADCADQTVTLRLTSSDAQKLSLSAETWWLEYGDRPLFGMSTQGISAWTDGKNLYLDTGRAYARPELRGIRKSAGKLALGLVLHGRVTKSGDLYHVTVKTDDLELDADLTADRTIRSAAITAVFSDQTTVELSITAMPTQPHPIPEPVRDAIVHSTMEPPIPLPDLLNKLLPALSNLIPLQGDLNLTLECGILNISETVRFRMDETGAQLERGGVAVQLPPAQQIAQADPAALALLLLRNASFTQEGDDSLFQVDLPPDATARLCEALLPQTANLGIDFGRSQAVLTIRGESVASVCLSASGEVPFLFTAIPLSLRAELIIPDSIQ